jgi:hypothetical protein
MNNNEFPINRTYNLYCDESCHLETDNHPYMLLSYICVPFNHIKILKENIQEIKSKHNFYAEIKWSKVSNSKRNFYLELVDQFFSSELYFRSIVIEKSQVKNNLFEQDFDTFYYKMYYQLIHHKIDMSAHYNIYLDIKDALSKYKVRKLREILNTQYGVIRTLQSIHSHESLFLQLTDFLMGAVNYKLRNFDKVKIKTMIINQIEKHCGRTIDRPTYKSEEKFNLFFIDLK